MGAPAERGTTPAGAGTTTSSAGPRPPRWDHPRGRGDDTDPETRLRVARGPPPRARGRLGLNDGVPAGGGTTPAGAGTTRRGAATGGPRWDHPRGRGDDDGGVAVEDDQQGPPPRARGRLSRENRHNATIGTTPAGAGTTSPSPTGLLVRRDHPRGRGDDACLPAVDDDMPGPPPRARGRRGPGTDERRWRGTTPAGAGTTTSARGDRVGCRDHPRGRGDDKPGHGPVRGGQGPPPRARGRRYLTVVPLEAGGTTPAGAGTTPTCSPPGSTPRDHPRGRGDDQLGEDASVGDRGPPPRARGRHRRVARHRGDRGTTPAGAGTTVRRHRPAGRVGDHPRGRGDDKSLRDRTPKMQGPPPRARGRPPVRGRRGGEPGTTPAGAGTTSAVHQRPSRLRDHPRGRGDDLMGSTQLVAQLGPPPRARGRPWSRGSSPWASRDHPRGRGDDAGHLPRSVTDPGPPPRARGRRPPLVLAPPVRGTTPAGAGTTARRHVRCAGRGDHPRGRGDDSRSASWRRYQRGPPPRARGRHTPEALAARLDGTTPAGAGTTTVPSSRSTSEGDHPRGRGDDGVVAVAWSFTAGPPPRARGRPAAQRRPAVGAGTTPAGAGTTCWPPGSTARSGDHPRGRGDDRTIVVTEAPEQGPPPRARGRPPRSSRPRRRRWDHPRGRGDDPDLVGWSPSTEGPPPRARGRHRPGVRRLGRRGTTPAGAGTTSPASSA